jgi:hypothetical protein
MGMEKKDLPEWVIAIFVAPQSGLFKYRLLRDPNRNNIVHVWPCEGMREGIAAPSQAMDRVTSWLDSGGRDMILATGITNGGYQIGTVVKKSSDLLQELTQTSMSNIFIFWEPDVGDLMVPAQRRIWVK